MQVKVIRTMGNRVRRGMTTKIYFCNDFVAFSMLVMALSITLIVSISLYHNTSSCAKLVNKSWPPTSDLTIFTIGSRMINDRQNILFFIMVVVVHRQVFLVTSNVQTNIDLQIIIMRDITGSRNKTNKQLTNVNKEVTSRSVNDQIIWVV